MKNQELPFNVLLNFKELIDKYKNRLVNETNDLIKSHLKNVLNYLESYPELYHGIEPNADLNKYKEPLKVLLGDIFPEALTLNEIKAIMIPFCNNFFNYTKRLENLLLDAGEDFSFGFNELDPDELYIMSCSIVLNHYYKKDIGNNKKPLYFKIPDKKGIIKTYKAAVNADFINIEKTKKSVDLSQEDIQELLNNSEDVRLWKQKIPPNSWNAEGFAIINLIDVTYDETISELKTALLEMNPSDTSSFENFTNIFRRLFNNEELNIGYTKYDSKSNRFFSPNQEHLKSYLLNNIESIESCDSLCQGSEKKLIGKREYFVISDVDEYTRQSKNNQLAKSLNQNYIKSCVFAPIMYNEEFLGVFELVSKNKYDLHSLNASKLNSVLPYLTIAVKKSKDEIEDKINAIIQKECTSIHSSVLWKFEQEAEKYLIDDFNNNKPKFNDISFDHVYPLFGQIDIKGSSNARNNAIQQDFIKQLNLVKSIFKNAYNKTQLPLYEQNVFRVDEFINEIKNSYQTSSEENILYFLKNEINPIIKHIKGLSDKLSNEIEKYESKINEETGIIFDKRANYENSVQSINEKMASLIDEKQEHAQEIFPHFFERFKTDGVEHNLYIGKSISQHKEFNNVYLQNLRLWQLITMCEMEHEFYNMQEELPLQLDCASLILVFSNSLSIRYRIDEKKFDVDGSYNARYEIIKKRIDKAHIKGTTERITQKGKLVIVFSQKKDEIEYKRYLSYLHKKQLIKDNLEVVELEDLQGVVGLKALRVDINYNNETSNKITYDDLIKEIEK